MFALCAQLVTNCPQNHATHLFKCTMFQAVSCLAQTYLKEIMREIGTYNSKGVHKSTWELKPEYRHYQSDEEEMQTT